MRSIKQINVRGVRLLIALLFLIASVVTPFGNFFNSDRVYANGDLVAWWKLDEGTGTTALDSSGNDRNGSLNNVTYSSTMLPTVEFDNPYSAYFNQSSSGRIITTPLSLNGYTEFTMAGWAYPTRADARASWFGQNDLFEFGFTDGDTLFCYTSKGEASWDFNPSTFLNQWHHITCLATANQLIIYVDGVNVASESISPGSFGSSGDNFSIGAGAVDGGNSGPFTGYIDDVRVYSRGLTPSEMGSLGSGSTGPTNGPNVTITSPSSGSAVNSWNPSVDWNDSDTCEYRFNSESWQTADCTEAGVDIPAPEQGADHTLSVRAYYDEVADPGTASSTFDYDTTAPNVNAGENLQTNSSFSQTTATASDSISGIASYAWSKQSGPGTITFSDTTVLNPTINAVSLDGTYTVRLSITDNAGNTAWDDFTLVWDTTSPELSLTSFPDRYTNQTNAHFSFESAETVSTPVTHTCKINELSFNSCSSPTTYSDLTEGDHTVTIRATDSVGNMTTSSPYVWTVDTTPPVITRSGDANITVVQGQSYTDSGATAVDAVDGTISEEISTSNPVNTANTGTYTVRYNVTDRAGNAATEVVRTVTVVSNEDRNNDGIADAIQNNVDGFLSQVNDKPVALEVSEDCTIEDAFIQSETTHIQQDPEYDYPDGLFNFTLSCGTPGYSATIKQYYYDRSPADMVLRKYNPNTNQYFTIDNANISSTTINDQQVAVVTYQVTDGGELDMDGEANGVIVDPAGLAAAVPATTTTTLASTGRDHQMILLLSVFISCTSLLVLAYRSQKTLNHS